MLTIQILGFILFLLITSVLLYCLVLLIKRYIERLIRLRRINLKKQSRLKVNKIYKLNDGFEDFKVIIKKIKDNKVYYQYKNKSSLDETIEQVLPIKTFIKIYKKDKKDGWVF